MWNVISNVSSVVTCVAFILYLTGHIWVVIKNRRNIYEKFALVPYEAEKPIEQEKNVLIIDHLGCEFSLESEYGINSIKIYKLDQDPKSPQGYSSHSKTLTATYTDLKTDKLFVRCDLGECVPTTQFEIIRSDYTIITFVLYQSGKAGHIITSDYKYKLTLKGIVYHLCV